MTGMLLCQDICGSGEKDSLPCYDMQVLVHQFQPILVQCFQLLFVVIFVFSSWTRWTDA